MAAIISSNYEPIGPGRLTVTFLRARDLRKVELLDQHPAVHFRLDTMKEKEWLKSHKSVDGNKTPVWNFSHAFDLDGHERMMRVEVHHHGLIGTTFIGWTEIPLQNLATQSGDTWYRLVHDNDVTAGEIAITTTWHPRGQPLPAIQPQPQGVYPQVSPPPFPQPAAAPYSAPYPQAGAQPYPPQSGPYPQQSGPYMQQSGPYPQQPGPYPQQPGPYPAYPQQPQSPYGQPASPYGQPAAPYAGGVEYQQYSQQYQQPQVVYQPQVVQPFYSPPVVQQQQQSSGFFSGVENAIALERENEWEQQQRLERERMERERLEREHFERERIERERGREFREVRREEHHHHGGW